MKTIIGHMDGMQWQDYCQKLIRSRHKDYQKVPSRFGGDYGIEGFTRSGILFQCYCPDDNPSPKELHKNQCKKITSDIRKLIKNVAKIATLGPNPIKEWHFFTPDYFDKDLLRHCTEKETEVKRRKLPQIDSDFKVLVQIEEDYESERNLLCACGLQKIQPSTTEVIDAEFDTFLKKNNKIAENIEKKIKSLSLDSRAKSRTISDLLKGYIIGKNELAMLNEASPTVYEEVCRLKAAIETQLSVRVLGISTSQSAMLADTLKDYEQRLATDFSRTLSSSLVLKLSYEAISDWLARCPLNFPVKAK